MLYQIKRGGAYISLINLNSDINFLTDTFFSYYAIFYDQFELIKAEIYLKKLNVEYRVEQYLKPKSIGKTLKQQNGTILKRMVCSANGQTNKQHNLESNSRTKISKGQGQFISDNEGLFEWEISRKDDRNTKRL